MKRNLIWTLLLCLGLAAIARGGPQASGPVSARAEMSRPLPRESARKGIDACALLTSKEIRAVQGEPVAETRPDIKSQGGLLLSECLFLPATFSKSVSLTLTISRPSDSAGSGLRQFWERQFHAASEPEHEQSSAKPRAISGLGEEAYWVSNPILGVLYVLQGDVFLRISVGGEKIELARLRKSKVLAGFALKRLPQLTPRP